MDIQDLEAPAPPTAPLRRPTPPQQAYRATATALVSGLGAAGLVVMLRAQGVLRGPASMILVLVFLSLGPTSREFSRRMALNGLIVAGWLQALWWFDLPSDRAGIALAGLAGVCTSTFVLTVDRRGVRHALPRFRVVDTIPLATAVLGIAVMRRWLLVTSPTDALSNLMPGWDNSGHFDMFRMIWTHGRTIDSIPAASVGDNWHYFDYPQGFHATAATIAQMAWPNAVHDVGASLLAYSKVSIGLVVGAVALIVASLCALPSMRRRWYLAAPLAALILVTFLRGPGIDTMRAGFTAFVYPCAILGAIIPIVMMLRRVASPVYIAAICSAVVLVAQSWALLLVIALPVVAAALWPLKKAHWRATALRWTATILVTLLSLGAVIKALFTLTNTGNLPSLTTVGWIKPPPFGAIVAITAVLVALAAGVHGRRRQGQSLLGARMTVLALSIPAVLVTSLVIGHAQIQAHGQIGYYTWKFLLAWLFIGCTLAVSLLASTPTHTHPAASPGRVARIASAIALSVAASQAYGYLGPAFPRIAGEAPDLATTGERQFGATVDSVREDAAEVLAAASAIADHNPHDAILLLPTAGALHPQSADQWYLSLTGDWTENSNFASQDLVGGQKDLPMTASVAKAWLLKYDGRLIVDPRLRSYMVDHGLIDSSTSPRVVTWAE